MELEIGKYVDVSDDGSNKAVFVVMFLMIILFVLFWRESVKKDLATCHCDEVSVGGRLTFHTVVSFPSCIEEFYIPLSNRYSMKPVLRFGMSYHTSHQLWKSK